MPPKWPAPTAIKVGLMATAFAITDSLKTESQLRGIAQKEFMYETIIRNTKKDNITITIEDHLPLSTDESMKITNGELTNGNFNQQTGLINWKLEIKSGESKKIRMGYKVKYPKDKVIQGL